jgi:amidase
VPPPGIVPPFELEEATLADLTAKLGSGELTARALAEAYLARIDAVDRAGPELRSVIEVNPDALAIADALDRERAEGHARGPLHGIPIMVKDNLDTADGMKTTAGSFALVDSRPAQDAPAVTRLRDAGALLLGKTNLSEWANFRSSRSSSGWSGRGGQCRNPYVIDRSPCGSSSGSGVAVSANLCAIAVGTETDGSVICPSSLNGIVGIKPTVGLVSGAGIVPISHTQDTAGPMARTVADAAALLAAMAETDVPVHLDPAGMRGARIGVARNMAGFDKRVDVLFEDALAAMRDLGAELIDPADVPHIAELQEPEWEVLKYEFKTDVGAYLASVVGDVPRSLAELIAFNIANADAEALAVFGQDIFEEAEEKGPLTDPAYLELLATCGRLSREEGLDAVLGEHSLDAVVAPSGSPGWLIDHVLGDHYVGGNSSPAAISGYPSITVPMGFIAGLPVGISFLGAARSESRLIGLAFAFERSTDHRERPKFQTTRSIGWDAAVRLPR